MLSEVSQMQTRKPIRYVVDYGDGQRIAIGANIYLTESGLMAALI
jgi:hypothetical protein